MLSIGPHVLEGKFVKLPNPLLVLQREDGAVVTGTERRSESCGSIDESGAARICIDGLLATISTLIFCKVQLDTGVLR